MQHSRNTVRVRGDPVAVTGDVSRRVSLQYVQVSSRSLTAGPLFAKGKG